MAGQFANLAFEVRREKLDALLADLSSQSGIPMGRIVRDQCRLLLKDCIRFTPPKTRAAGEKNVKTDFRKLFLPLSPDTVPEGAEANDPVFLWRTDTFTYATERARYQMSADVQTALAIHQDHRNRKGRVKTQGPFGKYERGFNMVNRVVVNRATFEAALQRRMDNVGRLKAGFGEGFQALGGQVPGWIARHVRKTGGHTDLTQSSESPSFSFWNTAAGANGMASMVSSMLQRRIKAIRSDLGRYVRNLKSRHRA